MKSKYKEVEPAPVSGSRKSKYKRILKGLLQIACGRFEKIEINKEYDMREDETANWKAFENWENEKRWLVKLGFELGVKLAKADTSYTDAVRQAYLQTTGEDRTILLNSINLGFRRQSCTVTCKVGFVWESCEYTNNQLSLPF